MTPWGIDSAGKKKRNPISIRRAGRRGFCPNGAGVRKAYCDVPFFLRVVFVRSTQARHLKVRSPWYFQLYGKRQCYDTKSPPPPPRDVRPPPPISSPISLSASAGSSPCPPPSHTDSTQQRKATRLSPNSPTPSFHPPRDDQRAKPPQPVKEIRKPGKRDRVRG